MAGNGAHTREGLSECPGKSQVLLSTGDRLVPRGRQWLYPCLHAATLVLIAWRAAGALVGE